MADGEIQYAFRVAHANVYERERATTAKLEAYRDGVLVAPTVDPQSTFELLAPDGTSTVGPKAITIVDEIATAAITAAELVDTLELSTQYQERWRLLMPDGTVRSIRRQAGVALFEFVPCVADVDLIDGEYPDLLRWLGDHDSTIQPWIDGATRTVLQKLFQSGTWPSLVLSSDAFYEPIRQTAYYRIFKWLAQNTSGTTNRWVEVRDEHKSEMRAAMAGFTAAIDTNHDGLPDGRGRQAVNKVHHKNAGFFRRMPTNPRW